ncbi:DUF6519 domain-containing protein [Scytonema sp. PRP1]|uniref:DUF6519 domain-containing protein n=1 Tax=Scytonema sp. PRP1 TaxID=3120513 RepID=UPI00300C24A3
MKGDFSRYTFNPKKQYSAVLMQQGRVQLDADWNEQQAINQYRIETETKDIIGLCGVPATGGGFAIKPIKGLLRIFFVNSQKGWVVGQKGDILATANGGQTWTPQTSGVTQDLWGVYFLTENRGWAVGDLGTILTTANGGQTWTPLQLADNNDLYSVYFANEQQGWTTGYSNDIFVTSDGGQSWITRRPRETENFYGGVFFVNNQKGWAVGSAIATTSDGGQTWRLQASEVQGGANGVFFINDQKGWVIGNNGTILVTTNGGQTWTPQTSRVTAGLNKVFFVNDQKGWVVGDSGTILVTSDGGQNWTPQTSGVTENLRGISFASNQRGWVIGDRGSILVTSDGGQTWIPQSQPNNFSISGGRIYVDGILCENEGTLFTQQPDFPGATFPHNSNTYLVYLDVWHRHITHLDDSLIREVALGGPDTTTRLKTIWQVKFLPIKQQDWDYELVQKLLKELQGDLRKLLSSVESSQLRASLQQIQKDINAASSDPENLKNLLQKLQKLLKQVEQFTEDSELIKSIQAKINQIEQELAKASGSISCNSKLPEWEELTAPTTGTLNARTQTPKDEKNPCLLPASAGYQRLENQLYRVEIHQGGTFTSGSASTVTFKWSRDNGSVVTTIEKISGQTVTVHDVGPDDVLGFANEQWVEVIDDRLELYGQPGQLLQIQQVKPETREIVLQTAPTPLASNSDGVDKKLHPKLRRWDSSGAITLTNTWMPLEGGIEVQFSWGSYKIGDYWLIPARTATGEIEWPPYEFPNTNPIPQLPLGMKHHYCRLAIVKYDDGILSVQEDCRKIFSPLPEVQTAIHVTDTNWSNDDLFSLVQLREEGLQVTLDAAPVTESVSAATMIVTLEVPFNNNISLSYILENASITTTYNVIRWQVGGQLLELLSQVLQNNSLARMRVTLKGHTIWTQQSDRLIYVDGQAFGKPGGTRTGTNQQRTALIFPSGAGVRASDFESWFYIGSQLLQIKSVSFISALPERPEQVSSAGVINFPLTSPANVQFYQEEEVNVVEITFNRTVRPDGLGKNGTPQSVHLDFINADNQLSKIDGDIIMVDSEVVRFFARERGRLQFTGTYRLTVFGNDTENGPAVKAQDDDALLDGDFNSQPGGNFELFFSVVIRPPR